MTKVYLDTNFLMMPYTLGVDVVSQLNEMFGNPEICVLEETIEELQGIAEKEKGKIKEAAEFGLKMLKNSTFHIVGKQKSLYMKINSKRPIVDDILLEVAGDAYVATQDKALKKRLKEKGIKIIILRNQKILEIN